MKQIKQELPPSLSKFRCQAPRDSSPSTHASHVHAWLNLERRWREIRTVPSAVHTSSRWPWDMCRPARRSDCKHRLVSAHDRPQLQHTTTREYETMSIGINFNEEIHEDDVVRNRSDLKGSVSPVLLL